MTRHQIGRTAGTWKFFAYFLRKYRRDTVTTTSLILIANLFEGVSALALFPALLVIFENENPSSESAPVKALFENSFAMLGLELNLESLLILIVSAMLIKGGLHFLAMRRAGHIAVDVVNGLRRRIVAAVFRARWSFFNFQPLGEYATALGSESEATAIAFTQLCVFIASSGLVLVYLGVLLIVSWQGLLLSIGGITLSLLVFRPLISYSRKMGHRTAVLQKDLVRDLIDTIPGIRSIRAMNLEGHFEPLLRCKTDELEIAEKKNLTSHSVMPSFFEPFLTLIIVAGYMVGSLMLGYSIPQLTIVAFSLWRAAWQMHLAHQAYRNSVAHESFFWSLLSLIETAERAQETHSGTVPLPDGLITLELDRVTFAYEEKPVLNGLKMTIPEGKITVVTGLSGTGKSTLIDLILALARPDGGHIFVNDTDLSTLSISDWRSSIGYVSQRTTLFHDSILHNITMGDTGIERAEAEAALKTVSAWEFVNGMPLGIDTVCGEAGSRISGGQGQRIAIARALVRRPRLLILDEATTALDPATERAVTEALSALCGSMTILAISHQKIIKEIADVIYYMDQGKARLVK